ncbi:hypothetical protein EYF80_045421 [Liparis tanakae]|uniref:Uncharacterized protein n=1 Tax=Liparis tanakae TaxID=230148 RepID=A0A4Z2FT87_9TELE|nr:hypothetical protein EYF80_045421 [Liparis tanakae]
MTRNLDVDPLIKIFKKDCFSSESKQDKETHSIKGVLMEDEHNLQYKGNHHHHTIKHLKLVLKEL